MSVRSGYFSVRTLATSHCLQVKVWGDTDSWCHVGRIIETVLLAKLSVCYGCASVIQVPETLCFEAVRLCVNKVCLSRYFLYLVENFVTNV